MKQTKVLPAELLQRGPDILRGGGTAFILTRYPDQHGNRWFTMSGDIGHEAMTDSHGMLTALFRPQADQYRDDVLVTTDVYRRDDRGNYAPTGDKKTTVDQFELRRLAKRHNLFGRYGSLHGRKVVMLWGAPEGWEAMVAEALKRLGAGPDTVVTVGTSDQFLAREFLGGEVTEVGQQEDQGRLDLLSRYHSAVGPDKAALARQLGLFGGNDYERPSSRPHWRRKLYEAGLPNVMARRTRVARIIGGENE